MDNLDQILKSRGIKQSWLAKKLGVTRESVNHWVKGKNQPGTKNLKKIAEILNISLDEFFFKLDNNVNNGINNNNKNKIKEPEKAK